MRKQYSFLTALLFCLLMLLSASAYSITSTSSTSLTTTSANAEYKRAYRYEKGIQVKRNLKSAIRWYKKAANKSHARAQYRLGILYYQEKNYKKARYWLKIRAKAGEADAQYHYANILRFGLGMKQQTSSSRKWYLKAAKQGHKQAQFELGILFKNGIGAKKSAKKAKKWLQKAAKQNHKQAKQALKSLASVERKSTSSQNKKTARQRFIEKNTRLAKAGNKSAQYKLGKAYKTGKKAPKDAKKALKWLKKAANANHPGAQYELANIYAEGSAAAAKNIKKAKLWYNKAADNDHKKANKKLSAIAKLEQKEQQLKFFDNMIDSALLGKSEQQYELGMHYLLGFKTQPDNQQAYYWFALAATQNHPRAMYQLGNLYLYGRGVEQDTHKAIHYFAASAKQKIKAAQTAITLFSENGYKNNVDAENGDKVAQLSLALAYLTQSSLDSNNAGPDNLSPNSLAPNSTDANTSKKKAGIEWLRKSASQKYAPALIELAKQYETGKIIPKDLEKAFNTYKTAAIQNNAIAQYRIGRMYQAGVGTEASQKMAYRWFEMAASQGLREAQEALQFSGL